MLSRKVQILIVLLLAAASAASAQQFANTERGFAPEKVFQLGEIDHVNLLNGNVIVTLPIGLTYPVGGNVSYSLKLVYNSKVWDFQHAIYNNESYLEALPDRLSNAGMGWSLSLGRLLEPDDAENDLSPDWAYAGSDGGLHVFYSTLHVGDNESATDPSDYTTYTRDGSFLRMRRLSISSREIDFPDGTIQAFQHVNGRWRLTQIRDRFGNALNVGYSADEKTWTLTDTSDPLNPRTHRILFSQTSYPYYDKVLERIELAAPSQYIVPATYTFGYGLTTYNKPCSQSLPIRTTVYVPTLLSVGLPDGSYFQMDYHTDVSSSTCEGPGAIKQVTLPTQGKIVYDYGLYTLPLDACAAWYVENTHGVILRRFLDAAGNETGRWTYTQGGSASLPISGTCNLEGDTHRPAWEESNTTVITPLKDKQVYYFSVYNRFDPSPSPNGSTIHDYGLPFTRFQTDATGTRFLSSQTYDCDAAGNNCVLERSNYVRYERDQNIQYCATWDAFNDDCVNTNRRLASSRTVFNDDSNRYADVNHSNYDGLGHYRSTATGGNFASGNARTTEMDYNPARGRYEIDPATNAPVPGVHTFTMLAPADPWVLATYASEKVTEGTNVSYAETCFEAANGFLQRKRTFASDSGTSQGASDLLAVYSRDPKGNKITDKLYGGDLQSLATGVSTCTMTPPATTQYWIDHTYQYGVLATSQLKDASGAATGILAFKQLDRDIDRNTGLPSVVRDTAGLATQYTWDFQGRPLSVKPQSAPAAAWEEYRYYNAVAFPGSPARVEARRCASANTTTCTPLTQEQFEYDSFGRLAKEKRLRADGTWAKRVTTYDAAGNKATVSELQADSTADGSLKKTIFGDYDPFGRIGTITPPDGTGHNITFTYVGQRTQTRSAKIGTGALDVNGNVPETSESVTEVYDRQGRLWRVNESSSPTGTSVTTEYAYDEGNRIGVVKFLAPEGTQLRYFNYDGRGFLASETHPEKGGAQVRYSKYDPLGNAGRVEDVVGGLNPNDVSYFYDRAGRLSTVWETGPTGRKLKDFTFADPASSCGSCNGKLWKSLRNNYVTVGGGSFTVAITETLGYGGPLGRVTGRTFQTRTNGGSTGEDFTQSFGYDELGNLTSLGYPQCTHSDCTSDGAASSRSVSFQYTNGWLTRIPGFVDTTITYHANGLWNQVVHGNGVTDVQTIDTTHWMARPSALSTTGALANWSSGTYRYDGAGNITKIGNAWFRYDRVNRMVSGTVYDGLAGGGNAKTQAYTYDTYGNITQIATTAGGSTQTLMTPTAWDTNRLTGGAYDAMGNLTSWNGANYNYDKFNQMWRMQSGTEEGIYLYTAAGERIWSYSPGINRSRWTIRDLDGRVLRDYDNNGGVWSVAKDYVYRGGQLVASVAPGQQPLHFHLDHLGSPRLITNSAKQQVAYHVYYPFGQEATAFNQDAERMKFTGHERDLASLAGPGDDLDYMHARFSSPLTGRFTSVDPLGGKPEVPQSWNRYAYALGNPLKYVDPSGMQIECSGQPAPGKSDYETVYCAETITVNASDCDNVCQMAQHFEQMGLFGFADTMTTVFYVEMSILMPTLLASEAPIIGLGLGAERAAGMTGAVWDAVTATQSIYEGTVIPRSFELATGNGKVWVHGNATKHMMQYARSLLGRGVGQDAVNLASQQQIRSLQAAIQTATAKGVPYGRLINVGGWELKFAAPRAADKLPVLIHALPK